MRLKANQQIGEGGGNMFGPTFSDPLCSLNLKETSELARTSCSTVIILHPQQNLFVPDATLLKKLLLPHRRVATILHLQMFSE
ncbi:hypothetical protein PVAP13_5NG548986 [Panicum virgatum]|uniref:Uncharacterized protein n=1 Tax=Panicum virgatum TaxID=38727 RepID=A0A8T0S6S1_PANVG|nr:hypothetical protein PVAP13_5NG548986 [Panicum virgatum]